MMKTVMTAAGLLLVSGAHAGLSPTLVALEGDTTLRLGASSVPMSTFGAPAIGAGGDLYFVSAFSPGVGGGDAIFVPATDVGLRTFESFLSTGDAAPGGSGAGFLPERLVQYGGSVNSGLPLHTRTSINASGDFAAWHVIDPLSIAPSIDAIGIWRPDGAGQRNVGLSERIDSFLVSPSAPTLLDDGRTLFTSFAPIPFEGIGDIGGALFLESAGVTEIAIGPGDAAPGTAALFASVEARVDRASGRVALGGGLYDDDGLLPRATRFGVWAGTVENLALVARSGDAAPGGGLFHRSSFSGTHTNGAGDVLFQGSVDRSGDVLRGVWRERDGALEVIAVEGDTAPGVPGATFARPAINADFQLDIGGAGSALFSGLIQGVDVDDTNDTGFWRVTGDSVGLLAREGSVAPGSGAAVFADFSGVEAASNAGSQYVFAADLAVGTGGVVEGVNDRGLWAASPASEELFLIVRTGQEFDVLGDGTDLRTINGILFNPLYGLADNGYLAYTLQFTDGTTAVFRTIIPTPGTLALFGGVLAMSARRRR